MDFYLPTKSLYFQAQQASRGQVTINCEANGLELNRSKRIRAGVSIFLGTRSHGANFQPDQPDIDSEETAIARLNLKQPEAYYNHRVNPPQSILHGHHLPRNSPYF